MLNKNMSLALLATSLSLRAADVSTKQAPHDSPLILQAPRPSGTNTFTHQAFLNAPLSEVLDVIAEKTGLIVFSAVDTTAKVSLVIRGEVSTETLIESLSAALAPNKIHLDLSGRLLKVLPESTARYIGPVEVISRDKPTSTSSTVGTIVVPLTTLDPAGLIKTLEAYLPQNTIAIASADAQALILHGRQRELSRVITISRLLDGAPAGATDVAVVPMRFADAASMAKTVREVFPQENTLSATNSLSGAPTNGESSNTSTTRRERTTLIATSDPHSNSLVMRGAAEELYAARLLAGRLDTKQFDTDEITIFRLRHADAQEMATALSGLFPSGTTQALEPETTNPEGLRKRGPVLAVPEARSNTLILRSPSSLVASLSGLIATLDRDSDRVQSVKFYQLSNADPVAVAAILQELFQVPGSTASLNSSQLSSALLQRAQRQSVSSATPTGNTSRGQQQSR